MTGNQPFGQLDLLVEPPVLIPRPETEEWVYKLINEIKASGQDDRPAKVLDLCSGSGCIGLALASELPRFRVTGLDINSKAVELAQKNASRNRVNNVVFEEVDLFDNQAMTNLKLGQFDIVVSNPPYIPPTEYLQLDRSVRDYEDPRALVGKRGVSEHGRMESTTGSNEDALDFYRRIRELAIGLLVKREDRVVSHVVPQIVMEYGQGQAAQVKSIFNEFPCTVDVDFNGIQRSIRVYGQAMK
jgi:release factor glutamine methyltransferase